MGVLEVRTEAQRVDHPECAGVHALAAHYWTTGARSMTNWLDGTTREIEVADQARAQSHALTALALMMTGVNPEVPEQPGEARYTHEEYLGAMADLDALLKQARAACSGTCSEGHTEVHTLRAFLSVNYPETRT